MAINITDFDKIWASTSPLTPYSFSDANYQEGWNFVGATPPARQMWDSYMKWSDEKQQWIVNNFLPLAGGTMAGSVGTVGADNRKFYIIHDNNTTYPNYDNIDVGWSYTNGDGACISLRSASFGGTSAGEFSIYARTENASKTLQGKTDGTLTWAGKNVLTDNVQAINSLSNIITFNSGYTLRGGTLHLISNFLVMLKIGINFTNSVSANTLVTIGTLASEYRPPNEAFGGGSDIIVYINNDGSIAIRPLVAKSSGSWVWSTILYTLI